MINDLAQEIHKINVKNGFYEDEKNTGEMLCLVHSEISEALEADRKDRYFNNQSGVSIESLANTEDEGGVYKETFRIAAKDTFEDEIADAMIRLMDLAAFKGIDLDNHIKAKLRYNSLREYKHGKKY